MIVSPSTASSASYFWISDAAIKMFCWKDPAFMEKKSSFFLLSADCILLSISINLQPAAFWITIAQSLVGKKDNNNN